MAWVWLLLAGLLEIVFAICLKLSEGFTKPAFTIAFIIATSISLFCLTKAMQSIPMGTAYAVWTGIGVVGVVIFGIVFFSEPVTAARIFFISTLVASIVGLKLISS
jgi:quaternary ammonium compound-resistance protein SugE